MDWFVCEGEVTKRGTVLLALLASMLATFVFLPGLLYASYYVWPPERTVEPRTSAVASAAPGESVETGGLYQVLRTCTAQFQSMVTWETASGLIQQPIPPHAGSVKLSPDGVVRIARAHTIPTTALPGTQWRKSTIARWDCFPFLGPLSPTWQQTYQDVVIQVR